VFEFFDRKGKLSSGIPDGDKENAVIFQKGDDLQDDFGVRFRIPSTRQKGFSIGGHDGGPMDEAGIDRGGPGQESTWHVDRKEFRETRRERAHSYFSFDA